MGLPASGLVLLSWSIALFRWDINIREMAAVLGIVGAGGVGVALDTALNLAVAGDQAAVVLTRIFLPQVILAEIVVNGCARADIVEARLPSPLQHASCGCGQGPAFPAPSLERETNNANARTQIAPRECEILAAFLSRGNLFETAACSGRSSG